MSPHAINSLVSDLVAMAQATERLPIAEQELSEARQEITAKYDTIQRLELKLIDRAAEIDTLHRSIRELEVAKDAAETMFLEADDRTSRALDFVKATFGTAGALIQALEPQRPEPVTERPFVTPSAEGDHAVVGESATDPIQTAATSTGAETPSVTETVTQLENATSGTAIADPTLNPFANEPSPEVKTKAVDPTSAPADLTTGTTTATDDTSASDPEPKRFDDNGWTTNAWYDWRERQDDKAGSHF